MRTDNFGLLQWLGVQVTCLALSDDREGKDGVRLEAELPVNFAVEPEGGGNKPMLHCVLINGLSESVERMKDGISGCPKVFRRETMLHVSMLHETLPPQSLAMGSADKMHVTCIFFLLHRFAPHSLSPKYCTQEGLGLV